MNWKALRWIVLVAALVLVAAVIAGCGGKSSDLPVIRVSHQPEFETFLTYRAIQNGVDKEHGVDLELLYFDSGMPQIEALPAKQWDVGATGGVPALMAALRYDTYVIGIADDESMANVVMARADNPVFQNRGASSGFPEIYGTAEQIKGKDVLATTVSSGHYALSSYLGALGLKDSDVNIMNLEQAQAVAAFDSGRGDFVALWAPFMYTGMQKGWKIVASGDQVGANIPLVLVADKEFADKNPELVVKFLDIYFKEIDTIKKEGGKMGEEYQAFLKDWAGMEVSLENAVLDIDKHPVYDLEEQLALFDNSNGPSEVERWMQGIADFFTIQGKFRAAERDKVMSSGFVTDKFLKMLAKERGLIK